MIYCVPPVNHERKTGIAAVSRCVETPSVTQMRIYERYISVFYNLLWSAIDQLSEEWTPFQITAFILCRKAIFLLNCPFRGRGGPTQIERENNEAPDFIVLFCYKKASESVFLQRVS